MNPGKVMKRFTEEALAEYNGKNGKPVYIAHDGKVYDVSESKLWKTGLHMKRHESGQDLTMDIQAAPHEPEVLERFSQVGELAKADVIEPKMPALLARLIEKYPFLRRHPHPMTVHFPIVFMISTAVFNILYMVTGIHAFETTAFHCLGGGVLFILVAGTTGYYTWWMNYMSQPMRAVTTKKRVVAVLFLVAAVAFIWRATVPDIMNMNGFGSIVYFLLTLSLFPLVTVIGWFGASLTFPTEKS